MKFTIPCLLALSLPLALALAGNPTPSCPALNMSSPALERVTQAFVDAGKGGKPIYTLPIPEARALLESIQEQPSQPAIPVGITLEILHLPVGPTGNVTVYLYKPVSGNGYEVPVVVYFHGGGWILGSPKTHQRLVLDLVHETGAAVFFVYYTPSPEAVYPVPIEQSYAAVQWLKANGKGLGIDSSRMGFAGDSAGGAMAASISLLSIQRNVALPRFQVLFYPVTDISCESETYREFAKGPGLVPETLRWMIGTFAPDEKSRLEDIASPMRASDKDLARFPETLIIVAEVDPLRQEGEDFGRKLQGLGVRTTIFRALGTIHDFVMFNPLAGTPAATGAIELAGYKLRRALE